MRPFQWLGVDFSGSQSKWRLGVSDGPVWIATIRRSDIGQLRLEGLLSVQELAGTGRPFERLTRMLAARELAAVAIDAPFSIPDTCRPVAGAVFWKRFARYR
jgi:hypothetical protein